MSYLALKHLHVSCAALSGALFLLRGIWMLSESPRLQQRWVRIVPHIVDTVLLLSALGLALWSGQYPFAQSWLSAKLFALVLYIGFGTMALKRARSKTMRTVAFVAALAVFAYIVRVAMTKTPF